MTGNSNFISQLRRDDLLVIFYTRRHEFLYRNVMSSQSEVTFYYFLTELVWYHQGLLQRMTSWNYNRECEMHSTTSSHWKHRPIWKVDRLAHTRAVVVQEEHRFSKWILPWVTKPANSQKCIKLSYIISTVFLLYVSATLVAIVRQVHYKGWIYGDTNFLLLPMFILLLLRMFRSLYSVYSLCINVCCSTANGCQPNCS
jgi:hypothetical protein